MKIFTLFLTIILMATSCRKFEEEKVVARAEPFVPQNLYPIERLPAYINRVAVMPCYYPDPDSTLLSFADDIFNQELSQERIFETVRIQPSFLKRAYGEGRMSSSSTLPEGFLKAVEANTMANAILFIDLSSYKPYKPMSLSVRAKLVDIKSGEFHWAIDETFDTGHANVIVGASIFQEKAQVRALSQKTSGSVVHSPRSFTKYIASTVFSTLPMR